MKKAQVQKKKDKPKKESKGVPAVQGATPGGRRLKLNKEWLERNLDPLAGLIKNETPLELAIHELPDPLTRKTLYSWLTRAEDIDLESIEEDEKAIDLLLRFLHTIKKAEASLFRSLAFKMESAALGVEIEIQETDAKGKVTTRKVKAERGAWYMYARKLEARFKTLFARHETVHEGEQAEEGDLDRMADAVQKARKKAQALKDREERETIENPGKR